MLSEFPHLTTPEFQDACNYLVTVFRQHGDEQKHWQAVESVPSVDHPYLNITKELQTHTNVYEKSEYDAFEHHDMKEEDDDEALQIAQAPPAYVHYDILLSPIYRVPVLYVSISDSQHRYPPTMDVLYEHLIPPQFKAQAESGGVIGGISITDHPTSNRPVFFIHPCQTTEVMDASLGKRDTTAHEYLLIWIGAIGKCVGLNIPLALMQHFQPPGSTSTSSAGLP